MYNTTPTITHTIAQRSAAIRAHTRSHAHTRTANSCTHTRQQIAVQNTKIVRNS